MGMTPILRLYTITNEFGPVNFENSQKTKNRIISWTSNSLLSYTISALYNYILIDFCLIVMEVMVLIKSH